MSLNNSLNDTKFDENLFKFYISQFVKKNTQKVVLKQFRRKGDFKKLKINSSLEEITFSNDLSKRRILDPNSKNYTTFPYGFK